MCEYIQMPAIKCANLLTVCNRKLLHCVFCCREKKRTPKPVMIMELINAARFRARTYDVSRSRRPKSNTIRSRHREVGEFDSTFHPKPRDFSSIKILRFAREMKVNSILHFLKLLKINYRKIK